MTKQTARTISQTCLILAVLTIFLSCGIFCTGDTRYGPEEFYDRGDGTLGYGASVEYGDKDTKKRTVAIGGTLFLLLLFASYGFSVYAEKLKPATSEKKTLDSSKKS